MKQGTIKMAEDFMRTHENISLDTYVPARVTPTLVSCGHTVKSYVNNQCTFGFQRTHASTYFHSSWYRDFMPCDEFLGFYNSYSEQELTEM